MEKKAPSSVCKGNIQNGTSACSISFLLPHDAILSIEEASIVYPRYIHDVDSLMRPLVALHVAVMCAVAPSYSIGQVYYFMMHVLLP